MKKKKIITIALIAVFSVCAVFTGMEPTVIAHLLKSSAL